MAELDLSKKVALLAKAKNITQKQIAEYCQISRITVHRFFTGKTEVRSSDFVKMLQLMGINVEKQIESSLSTGIPEIQSGSSAAEPVFTDIAMVLNNLKTTVRKALLEQILWWGQTSNEEPILVAVDRIKKYIKENPSPVENV